MAFKLKQFNAASIASTVRAWQADKAKCTNIFPAHVDVALDLAKNKTNYAIDETNAQLAYGVFGESPHIAQGIVDVIVTKRGRKLAKMLDCHIRPSIADKAVIGSADEIVEVADVYVASVFGALELGGDHNVSEVKVYGRSKELLSVLVAVRTVIAVKKINIKAVIEGRWLVLKV